ncbi:hypothetical protein N9Z41_02160 [bacterium]|nr:hypothetical protein [bacterium]
MRFILGIVTGVVVLTIMPENSIELTTDAINQAAQYVVNATKN